MTTQQTLPSSMDEAGLTALYEAGQYTQALDTIEKSGLLTALEEQPDAAGHASLALLVANLHRDLARYSTAERYYLQALAGLTHTPGQDHPGYARGLAELGTLYQLQGRYTEAHRTLEQARTIHENAAEPDPLAHASCLLSLAYLHDTLDERRRATPCLTRARALIVQAGAPPLDMAALKMKEAWVLCRIEGLGAVVDRAREALAVFRSLKGERCIAVLQARYQLGRLLMPLWYLDEAGPLVEGLVPICREVLCEEHPLHAAALESLGRLRMCQGELLEAEDLTQRSLTLTVAALGERHLDVAARHRSLGTLLQAENRLTAAAERYEQALMILREVLGEEHPQVADLRLELAAIRENAGEHCKAVEQMRAVIELLDRHPDDVRSEQAGACLALARLQVEAGDLDEAGSLTRRATSLAQEIGTDPILYVPAALLEARICALQGKVTEACKLIDLAEKALAGLPSNHPMRLETAGASAWMARLAGDPARAVRLARETLRRAEKDHRERWPCLAAALGFLAEQLHFSAEFVESEKTYERLVDLQRRRQGREHPDVAVTLRGLAQLHLSRGNVAAAEVRFREALDIRRASLGDRHPLTAESLCDLAWLLYQAGNLIPAEGLFRNTFEVRQECLGATHPDTLASQHGLALVALARGAPASAAELLEQGLALIGDDHPQKLPLMHSLARACYTQGNRARALTLLREVLLSQEKTFGENHDGLVPVLADLVQVHAGLGDHLAARALLERIRMIRAHSPVPDPIAQAFDLVSLSDSHRQLGDLARAGDLARQALDMARGHLKQGDPGLVGYLTHFARTCQAKREFSAARRHFHEALAVVRKTGGDRHPLVAGLCTDLAGLEVSRGKPRRATPLYTQAAELIQAVLGEDHPDHATALRVLGQHLQTLGEYAGAEEALRRHLNIVLRTYGAEHPAAALAYQALSELQRERGDLTGAITSCRHALDLIRRAEIPLDALHANLLHALAVLHRQQGQLPEAANLLGHALEIDRTSVGEEGVGHLDSLYELAIIEAARGEDASALKRLHRVISFQDELTAAFGYLSPGQVRDALLARPWLLIESFLTLALRLPDAAELALAGVLRWKGLGSTDLVPGDRMALRRRHPAHAHELDRLFDLGVQIACRLVRGAGPEGLQMHHDLLRRWEEERQGLEGQLAGTVPTLARLHALRAVDLPGLRRALPAGATCVELVRFRPRDFAEVCAGRDGLLPPRYLGFVLHAGEERVVMCDLGRAVDVEKCGGARALRVALAPHLAGRRQLFVATAGHFGRAIGVQLGGPQTLVRTLASGREVISPLLARPAGWLPWLRGRRVM